MILAERINVMIILVLFLELNLMWHS